MELCRRHEVPEQRGLAGGEPRSREVLDSPRSPSWGDLSSDLQVAREEMAEECGGQLLVVEGNALQMELCVRASQALKAAPLPRRVRVFRAWAAAAGLSPADTTKWQRIVTRRASRAGGDLIAIASRLAEEPKASARVSRTSRSGARVRPAPRRRRRGSFTRAPTPTSGDPEPQSEDSQRFRAGRTGEESEPGARQSRVETIAWSLRIHAPMAIALDRRGQALPIAFQASTPIQLAAAALPKRWQGRGASGALDARAWSRCPNGDAMRQSTTGDARKPWTGGWGDSSCWVVAATRLAPRQAGGLS